MIYTESETEILKVLQTKWKQHNELVGKMTEIIKENGLNIINSKDKLMRTLGIERKENSHSSPPTTKKKEKKSTQNGAISLFSLQKKEKKKTNGNNY